MTAFKVVTDELRGAARKIEECLQAYEQANASAKTAADDLAARWEGDARNAFVEEQQKAFEWYAKMTALIRTYAAAMEKAAKTYDTADDEAARIIKSV